MEDLVFVHDHKFKRDEKGRYFSEATYNDDVWNRYLKFFENIIILGRVESITSNQSTNFNQLPERVKVVELTDYKNPIKRIINFKKDKDVVRTVINENKYVIVRLPSVFGKYVIKEMKRFNKQYLVELVGCPLESLFYSGGIVRKLYAIKMYLDTKRMIKESKFVLYVTETFLQKRYKNNNKNVGCSDVILDFWENPNSILERRVNKIKMLKKQKIYKIGLIGSLKTNYKGIDLAIEAIKILAVQGIDLELEVIGQGDGTRFIKQAKNSFLENRVNLLGTKTREEINLWLDKIDIYIQPSRTEGMPRATIEAMSRGVPIVSSDVGGLKDLININVRHKRGDAEDLAKKILLLVNNYEKMYELSQENLEKAYNNYEKNKLNFIRKTFMVEFIEESNGKNKIYKNN